MRKTVLISGATSQIGRFLLSQFSDSQFDVYAISRNNNIDFDGVTWIKFDLQKDNFSLLYKYNINILIHLAEITMTTDLVANLKSLERVIAFSSTSLVVKKDSKNLNDRRLSTQLQEGESNLIQSCSEKNVQWTIFRPTLIYGSGLDQNIEFITQFIKRYHFFPIMGKGNGLRQPVHAYDLAQASLNVIDARATYCKIYNLSGGEVLTYFEMVSRVFNSLDKAPVIIRFPKVLFYIAVSLLRFFKRFKHLNTGMVDRLNEDLYFDSSDAKNDFGYNPNIFFPNVDIKDVL
jgi:nucleoside-diphosphate-sugar epimerase